MSIFDNISKSAGEIRDQIEKEFTPNGVIVDTFNSVYSTSLYPRLKASEYLRAATGWVYGCVGVIADEVAGIDLKMLKVKGNDVSEVDEHEALDVLYRANNAMTRFDLINLTFQYLELAGEAPWFISFKNNKPDQIFLLRPDRLTVLPGKDGEMVGGYEYQVYGEGGYQKIKLESHEVIPLKYTDPDQPLRGKGPLQAAAETYDLDNYAEKWNSQFYKNSAAPSGALVSDKILSKDVRARLERKLKDNYRGIENAHKTMILEQGLKFEKISLTQKDMDFIEQQRFSRDKILAIFRVPRTALGITDDVNRANAEATDYVFAKRTIRPKMIRFVEQLNEFFLPLFGTGTENLYFDFADPVPENVEQLIQKAQSGVSTGYMTINEARELMSLDPLEGGDTLRDPMGFGVVTDSEGNSLMGKKRKTEPTRYQKQLSGKRTRNSKNADIEKKVYKQVIEDKVTPIIYSFLKNKRSKKKAYRPFIKGTDEEIKEAKYVVQDKQLNIADEYEPKVIKILSRIFESQKDITLRQIENGENPKIDPTVEVEKYMKALKPTMIKMMREQSDLAFQIVGANNPFNDGAKSAKALTFLQRLTRYFEIRTFRFATEVSKQTNQQLRDEFAEGVDNKESIPELKKRVSTLFDDMASYRSERIARTETILGSNFSTEEAYKESGVVEAKEWLTTRDERTDDECAALDGKIVDLGDKFFKDGYFGGETPPIHVNCRCTIIPVIKA